MDIQVYSLAIDTYNTLLYGLCCMFAVHLTVVLKTIMQTIAGSVLE